MLISTLAKSPASAATLHTTIAPTMLKGRVSMRVAITNFRTREDDLRALLDEASRLGKEIA